MAPGEPAFGADFSGVRVHSDARAAESASRHEHGVEYALGDISANHATIPVIACRDGASVFTHFAGQCGLVAQEVAGRREVEIGYLCLRRHWGRGLATEAARACRDYGFERLGRSRLISIITPANRASRRVAEKTGLHLEKEVEWRGLRACVYAIWY